MRAAHTVEQVRAAEAALMRRLPEGTLMQRAAGGLAAAVLELLGGGYGRRVLLVVGSGDNGGDALYAGARLARRGAAVHALLLDPARAHAAGLQALRRAGGRTVGDLAAVDLTPGGRPDVVVDGVVGIGGRGGLRPQAVRVVEALSGLPWVAVDVPSGVDVDTGRVDGPHVQAAVTVTFGTHKVAHLVDPAARACGTVDLVDIGLDGEPDRPGPAGDLGAPMVTALQAHDVAALLPVPAPDAHKYTRGVVGVRAGSGRYPGAGVLCVSGADTGLVGMVRYVPGADGDSDRVVQLVHQAHPDVVVGPGRVQAWVVGSGGGDRAADALRAALEDAVPVVVDADALDHVSGPLPVPALLTPHAGELARMLDVEREQVEAEQLSSVREAARRFGCTVLLKGRRTLVSDPDGAVRATTVGVPWLATAGAGDVLAGLCGALLAAGLSPYDAGAVGAWLHAAAATRASAGGPTTAPDVARAVPEVCRRLLAAGADATVW
ncbi:MAG TPA: NAD(P)H-hydrate epimerase [Nocardioidaceae bacterium]|nr:NAD(P)H-hydrate epimerase [Nocardioidaceae bacterium]